MTNHDQADARERWSDLWLSDNSLDYQIRSPGPSPISLPFLLYLYSPRRLPSIFILLPSSDVNINNRMPSRVPATETQTNENKSKLHIRDLANTDASTSAPLPRVSSAFAQLLDTLLARIARLTALFSFTANAHVNAITSRTTPATASAASMSSTISAVTKTVVVLGCAYGGASFFFVFSFPYFFFIFSVKPLVYYFCPHRLPAFLRMSLACSYIFLF